MERLIEYLIVEIPEAALMLIVGMSFFNENAFSQRKRLVVSSLLLSVISALLSEFNLVYEIRMLFFYITAMLLLAYAFKQKLIYSIGAMAATFVVLLIAESITLYLFNQFNIYYEQMMSNHITRYVAAFILFGNILLLFAVIRKMKIDIKKIVPRETRYKYLTTLIVLMSVEFLLILFLNTNFILGSNNEGYTLFQNDMEWLLYLVILVLFILITMFFVFYLKSTVAHVQIVTETPYVQNINDFVVKLRAVRHDAVNHIAVIQHLIKERQIDDAIAYANQTVKDVREVVEMVKEVKNLAISAIIQSKKETCNIKNIDFSIKVETNWQLKHIKTNDLVTILGNLLDNAIEANDDFNELPKKEILFSWIEEKNEERLTFTNTGKEIKPENLDKIFNLGFTTKGNVMGGTGLTIVRQIVEKHKGKMKVQSNKEYTVFTIVFPKPKQKS